MDPLNETYFERDGCVFLGLAYVLCLFQVEVTAWKRSNAFSWSLSLLAHYFSPFELAGYIWKGGMWASHCFSSSWLLTPSAYGRCNSWLTSRDGFGYVFTAGTSALWNILSALALVYLILLTTVKACNRASSVGYSGFSGHIIQSGSINLVAICFSLVFVLTRLKLTLGCLPALQSHGLFGALSEVSPM